MYGWMDDGWMSGWQAWPQCPLAVVEGFTVGRLTVVILLSDVGLLSLTQSTERSSHGRGSWDTAGTEEGADVWSGTGTHVRGTESLWTFSQINSPSLTKSSRTWSLFKSFTLSLKKVTTSFDFTLTERLLLGPAQVVSGKKKSQRQTPAGRPSYPAVTAPHPSEGPHVQAAVLHHSYRQNTASCNTDNNNNSRRRHISTGRCCEVKSGVRNVLMMYLPSL